MQRVGTAIGVAIIGSILFAALTPDKMMPNLIGQAFKDGAAAAMLTSALMALAAFFLVFTLPKRIQLHGAPSAVPAGE
jgi:Na+-translocating ferredoxin:NAD+ oxidoreductase RnfA subunit